jgi:hypothetical protein
LNPKSTAVIKIMSAYFHPLTAQSYIEKYCNNRGIGIENFRGEHVARFALTMANRRSEFGNIPDDNYRQMLNDLVKISNSPDGSAPS